MPTSTLTLLGNQEVSEVKEDYAFAFMVTESQDETCNTISCEEPAVEIFIDGTETKVLIDSGSVDNHVRGN